jgi:spore coat protein CotH
MKKWIFSLAGGLIAGFSSAQSNGTQLFDESFVHRIDVTFQQTSFWDSLSNYYDEGFNFGTDVKYMMGSVTVDGTVIDSIGVKQKGFFSNWGAGDSFKKPLKISMNQYVSSQKYDGLRKINLSNGFQDPSMMRDALAYKFMRSAGLDVPRTAYTKLYLNGTYWGLYLMVEEVDKRALKNWYTADSGNLFKCINNTSLEYQGNSAANYQDEFELQTNETANDWSRLIYLTKKIGTPQANFEDSILQVLNIDQYLYVLAADIIMYNWDSYYDHGRNFFLYQNPETNLMDWIPWDYNLAFSTSTTDLIIDYSQTLDGPKQLVKKIQEDPELRSSFFDHVCILMDNYFTLGNLESYINTTAALIRPELNTDNNKFFSIGDFDASIHNDVNAMDPFGQWSTYKGLTQFITERQSAVAQQLSNYQHECTSLGAVELALESVMVYPNPFESTFTVEAGTVIEQLEVYAITGQLLVTQSPKTKKTSISLDDFASGSYLIRTVTASGMRTIPVNKK